ncbi:MAG: hypothetical protein M9949_01530 [Candidatus Kapabacteria bacterium]|nr:hypothetical protein [Candidatus Kapabacteria bacterium]
MSWNKIIGHEKIKRILQNDILNNSIANAYCFVGPEGIGKDAMAIAFAKVMNCKQAIHEDNTVDACGVCKSCQQFDNLSHPNFELIFSLPTGKAGDSESPFEKLDNEQFAEVRRELQSKSENHYHRMEIKGANFIRVSFIRFVKRKLLLSNSVPGRRFILVSRADEMNVESANAFLKTLEEPHNDVTIVLTSSKAEGMLPTIMSRCRKVQFSPVEAGQIKKELIENYGFDEESAHTASLFSGGSPVRALQFESSDLAASRNAMVNMLRQSLKRKDFQLNLSAAVEELVATKDKNKLFNDLKLFQLWLRDVSANRYGGGANLFNSDDALTIIKFDSAFRDKNILKAIEEVDASMALVHRNVNPQLILYKLFFKLREIFLV